MKDLFAKYFHIPRRRPGWSILAVSGAITAILSALYLPLGLIGLAIFIYLQIIVRPVPNRPVSETPTGSVFAPIDGQIIWVNEDVNAGQITVRIQPDWFNSHMAYAPIVGEIEQQIWYDGQFVSFADDIAPPPANARQEIVFSTAKGAPSDQRVELIHYGSPASRLIQSLMQEGQQVTPAMAVAYGLVRTKIDLKFSSAFRPCVQISQRCLAGETILASRKP